MANIPNPLDRISLNHASLRHQVADGLRTAIFAGGLKPGDRIKERHLANSLGVSQATVREALLHLESMGLVVRMKNRGTLVKNLTKVEAQERIAVRKKLEGWALVEVAGRMAEQEFSELQQRFSELSRAVADNSYLGMAQVDLEFHRYLWRCSGNAILYEALDNVCGPLFAFVSFLNRGSPGIQQHVIVEHTKIMQVLRQKEPDKIRQAISRHIDVGYEEGRAAHLKYGYE